MRLYYLFAILLVSNQNWLNVLHSFFVVTWHWSIHKWLMVYHDLIEFFFKEIGLGAVLYTSGVSSLGFIKLLWSFFYLADAAFIWSRYWILDIVGSMKNYGTVVIKALLNLLTFMYIVGKINVFLAIRMHVKPLKLIIFCISIKLIFLHNFLFNSCNLDFIETCLGVE